MAKTLSVLRKYMSKLSKILNNFFFKTHLIHHPLEKKKNNVVMIPLEVGKSVTDSSKIVHRINLYTLYYSRQKIQNVLSKKSVFAAKRKFY